MSHRYIQPGSFQWFVLVVIWESSYEHVNKSMLCRARYALCTYLGGEE